MGLITIYAGSAIAATLGNPTEWPASGAQQNRRSFADLTGVERARLSLGNSTAGLNTAELFAEVTTDLTGATGWTALGTYVTSALTGPLINVSQQNYAGPWVPVPSNLRTLVAVRIRGRLGDAATSFNTTTLRLEVRGHPLRAANTLTGGTAGPGVIMFGGSQIAGGGTIGTGVGEFGTLPAPLVAVPAGCTLMRQGVTLTEHDDGEHGAEAGFLAACADAGVHANLVCRYVDATVAANWTDTHLATLATDVTNAGITPRLACYIQGGGDGQSDTTVGAYDFELRRLLGALQGRWPGIALVAMPIGSQDTVEHPKLVEARVPFKTRMEQPDGRGLTQWVTEVGIELQADNRHPTSVGEVEMGRRFAAPWIAAGMLV